MAVNFARRTRRGVRMLALALVMIGTNAGIVGALPAPGTATTLGSGAMFGVYAGLNPAALATAGGDLGPTTYIPGLVAWQGRTNGVLSAFGNINDHTNTFGSYFPKMWNTFHSVPMYSIVSNQHTNEQIVAGENDAAIARFGQKLDAFINGVDDTGVAAPPGGRRIYLRPLFEPNSVAYPNYSPLARVLAMPADQQTCENLLAQEQIYVAAWRHIHDVVMANGNFTPNQVHWIFNTLVLDGTKVNELAMPDELRNCANGASDIMERIYPGDAYVDSVSMDGFHYVTHPREPVGRDLPASGIFGPMLARLRAMTSKPVGIDEVGASTMSRTNVNVKTPAEKDEWLSDFFQWVEDNDIRRVVWDNLNGGPTDWSIYAPDFPDDPTNSVDYTKSRGTATDVYMGVTYNVYAEYKNGVNRPFFVAPDLSNPRLVSDESFRGDWAESNATQARPYVPF